MAKVYFTDYFDVAPTLLEKYGAFNISLVTDLPLFIDPFLLFNSKNRRYRELHDEIIRYLLFLRDKANTGTASRGLIDAWYRFPEVHQTWLGFTTAGNRGSGLGMQFADSLHTNLNKIFSDFGSEKITKGSHLEKLCLIRERVGRDNISDFTTNLIKRFLCEYTQDFALKHIDVGSRKNVVVLRSIFNYDTEVWEPATYELPWLNGDYVLLTPKDILTKDDTWINKTDLVKDFESLPTAVPSEQLRAQISNYFEKVLGRTRRKEPTQKEKARAAQSTILQFPELIDVYIRYKEDRGDVAVGLSAEKVRYSQELYYRQFNELLQVLSTETGFYKSEGKTYEEAHERIRYLKDAVENKGCHKIFYVDGNPIQREEDVHILFRVTWFGTDSDVSREVNDGRGPADFKISRGASDKTIVEFKLAKNSQLKRNLAKQAEVYTKASDAKKAIKVIVFFSAAELRKLNKVLKDTGLHGHPDVVLIDARADNKPSGSKA